MWRATAFGWLLVLCAIAANVRIASAQDVLPPFEVSSYPGEVQKSLQAARDACKENDGKQIKFAPDTVRTIDLTGDGKPDYIVSFEESECDGNQVPFCGTGGCDLDIIVTLPNGKLRNVFSNRIRGYEIQPG